jgi:hypothetical protein
VSVTTTSAHQTATPPPAWAKAVFPDGYQPAYAPTFRGAGVTT